MVELTVVVAGTVQPLGPALETEEARMLSGGAEVPVRPGLCCSWIPCLCC